jgi:transcriptional regulator with XRE-family HTH domain
MLREQRGMTQEALAERAGLDRKLIYRTELGQTSPRLDAVVAISGALDLDIATLVSVEQAN